MINKIVLNSDKYLYTFLDDVFYGIGDAVKEYNWLLSDYECNLYPNNTFYQNMHNYIWLSYEELSDLILGQYVQFIWGVCLAFEKNIKKEDVLKYPLPVADYDISFKHPLSQIEILSLDSSELYILAREESYIQNFLKKFPEAKEYVDD